MGQRLQARPDQLVRPQRRRRRHGQGRPHQLHEPLHRRLPARPAGVSAGQRRLRHRPRVAGPSNSGYGTSLHAGGILWYGNHLFVADTARGFRMFDMRRIYDLGASPNGTTSGSNMVGRHGNTYYGYGYRYVMPQVGSWTRTAPTGTKCTTADGSPQFSHVSSTAAAPTTSSPASVRRDRTGQRARRGLADRRRLRREQRAGHRHVVPVERRRGPQAAGQQRPGPTRFNGRWYLSRSRGKSTAGTFYTTAPATSSTTTLQVASSQQLSIGPEDLSHWQSGTDPANLGLGDFCDRRRTPRQAHGLRRAPLVATPCAPPGDA